MRIPAKVKLEKVVSKDQSRPVLSSIYLRVVEPATDDESGRGYLEATDSYKLARVPVELEPGDVEGYIPPAALVEARKVDRLTPRLEANGTVDVPGGPSFPRPKLGTFANTDALIPAADTLVDFEVGFDSKLLYELAQGLGETRVRIRFCAHREYVAGEHVDDRSRPSNLRPIVVRPLGAGDDGAIGLLMPIRVTS